MNERPELMDTARRAVDRTLAAARSVAGAAAVEAEAFVQDATSVEVTVSGRAVERLKAVTETGLGVRLLWDQRMAFGSSNDLSPAAVDRLVQDLAGKVVHHTPDPYHVIPGAAEGAPSSGAGRFADLGVCDARVAQVTVEEKVALALRMEAAGLDYDRRIEGTVAGHYEDRTAHTYLANSRGVEGWFAQSSVSGSLSVVAADGQAREAGGFGRSVVRMEDFDCEAIGRRAAEKAVAMLGAAPIASRETVLVVSPETAAELLEYLGYLLSAEEVQKGRSRMAGKVGSQVAAPLVTLIDDGRLPGGLATAPVDGEGVETGTTPLISQGRLETYLYDAYCARRGGTRSTGNRARGGYGSAGNVGPTNLYMAPGSLTAEAIIGGVDGGFYLTGVLGLFAAIDPASGDFSIPSKGFRIEHGELTAPVRGVALAGNLFELLQGIDAVGSDLEWLGSIAAPTFRVRSVLVGGKAD